MAGNVSFVLDAETKRYLAKISKAQKDTAKSLGEMDKKFEGFGKSVDKSLKGVDKAIESFSSAIGVGGIGVAAAVGFKAVSMLTSGVMNAGKEAAEARKKWDELAKSAKTDTDTLLTFGNAAIHAGVGFETLKSGMSEAQAVFDKLSTDGAGMSRYFDLIEGKINRTKVELAEMSTIDALRVIQSDLEQVGATSAQQQAVFKEMGKSVEAMTPALKLTDAEIKKLGNATVMLSKNTTDIIEGMDNEFTKLGTNVKTYVVESLADTFKWMSKIAEKAASMFGEGAETAKNENLIAAIKSGADVSKYSVRDFENAIKMVNGQLADSTEAMTYYANMVEDELGMNRQAGETKFGVSKEKAYEDYQANLALIEKLDGHVKSLNDKARKEDSDKQTEETIRVEKDKLKTRLEFLAKYFKTEEEGIRNAAALQKHAIEEEFKQRKGTKNPMSEQDRDYALGIVDQRTQDQINKLREQEAKARQDALKKQKDEAEKAAKEEQKRRDDTINAQIKFEADKYRAMELETQKRIDLAKREAAEINKINGEQVISQIEVNRKVAVIQNEATMKAIEERIKDRNSQQEFTMNENDQTIADSQYKLELLKEALANKKLTQDEYDKQYLEQQRNIRDAERALTMSKLDEMTSLFSGMSQLAAQGSKQQRALFLVEKASTIASMSLKAYDAWAGVDKDPSLVTQTQKAIAKAKIIAEYGTKIGAAGAVAIRGQFHDGSSYVEGTGSYYLQQGERVISQRDNRDLTDYLKANERSGGATTVNADLVIQGGSSMTDDEWQARLLQYRETVVNAVNLARSENPSYS